MKKNNGRGKAGRHRPKARKAKQSSATTHALRAARAPAPRQARPALARPQSPASRSVRGLSRAAIDWPAVLILALSLALLTLIGLWQESQTPVVRQKEASHGHLAREAVPLAQAPSEQVHVQTEPASIPTPQPAHGDLAHEDVPAVPEPPHQTPVQAGPETTPTPEPAHEAMPIIPEPSDQAHAQAPPQRAPMPEPAHDDLALAAPPIMPEPSPPTPARIEPEPAPTPSVCMAPETAPAPEQSRAPEKFGNALAAAAEAQTSEFVIYNARYISLAYPGGDTPPLYGVCTDVLIRAYRALGIDFQELIHTARLGRGDRSIDHRRVEVVRQFLERHGTRLPISEFAEDYRPGDIVTYHRPGGRVSQHHVALVSKHMAPSGRPLIVHNRGWGPQLEDALFVDRITGHYRLSAEQVEHFRRTRAPRTGLASRRTADAVSTRRH